MRGKDVNDDDDDEELIGTNYELHTVKGYLSTLAPSFYGYKKMIFLPFLPYNKRLLTQATELNTGPPHSKILNCQNSEENALLRLPMDPMYYTDLAPTSSNNGRALFAKKHDHRRSPGSRW